MQVCRYAGMQVCGLHRTCIDLVNARPVSAGSFLRIPAQIPLPGHWFKFDKQVVTVIECYGYPEAAKEFVWN